MTTFVLVHGGFHGGWCWVRVAQRLRAAGHRVCTPTQTGLGERSHLASADVGLDTFIADVLGVLEYEELSDVVLVGHSFGAVTATGVADRAVQRLRRLILLDGIVVENGRTPFDGMTPEAVAQRIEQARAFGGPVPMLKPLSAANFAVTDPDDAAWLERRLTPHPLRTYQDVLHLDYPIGNGLPCTYIACTDPRYPAVAPSHAWARDRAGWSWRELATGHDAMITAPQATADLLAELA